MTEYKLHTWDLEKIKRTLKTDGWEEVNPGGYYGHDEVKPYKYVHILHKAMPMPDGAGQALRPWQTLQNNDEKDLKEDALQSGVVCSASGDGENPTPALNNLRGQISPYGPKENYLPPDVSQAAKPDEPSETLADLTSWSEIPSIKALQEVCTDTDILIGYDSEWQEIKGSRFILSWQFACRWHGVMHLFLVLTNCRDADSQWSEKINMRLRLSHI